MKRMIVMTAAALCFSGFAVAKNSYMSPFNSLYGTDGTRLDDCNVCHTSGSKLNAYGSDFGTKERELGNVTLALEAIETWDSDTDRVANAVEIQYGNFPGDSSDTSPTERSTWGAIKALYE
jgi:hypothetical protein